MARLLLQTLLKNKQRPSLLSSLYDDERRQLHSNTFIAPFQLYEKGSSVNSYRVYQELDENIEIKREKAFFINLNHANNNDEQGLSFIVSRRRQFVEYPLFTGVFV